MFPSDSATTLTGGGAGYTGGDTGTAAERGLDWFNLFVGNVQTGFGPYITIYLTTQGWTQTTIGLALSLGTITAMVSQMPAGALVDAARSKSGIALFSMLAFSASALLFAVRPTPLSVYFAEMIHAFSSCALGPTIAAMSLAIAAPATLGLRLGRNARFASIGNGIGAALMGICGYYLSERWVFFLTAFLALPALVPLRPLARADPATRLSGQIGKDPAIRQDSSRARLGRVLADRRLLVFAACATLFTLGNAAMLPLAASALTARAGSEASLLIAACIVLPQLVVAVLSPSFGELAQTRGRRWILLIGLSALPIRGMLFALLASTAAPIVLVQLLDGIAAACFGVSVPLITSDIAGGTGHYNFSLGFVGFSIGIGATVSTTLGGWIADRLGDPVAFASLATCGVAAFLLALIAMPETRPPVP